MRFLYHLVPAEMRGTTLYPLNQLKDVHPDIYEKEFSKYEGRLQVPKQHVPILDCLWNDVLHLSAVAPADIKKALGTKYEMRYYQIDPHALEPENAIVYLFQKSQEQKYDDDNWAAYNPNAIGKYATIPQRTLDYFEEMREKGERPLIYMWVPHILYRGTIDVSKAPILTV